MTFQTPVTVESVLKGIHTKAYLLPAIQREFVWDTGQVRALFDSLLRGYPIGSFLFWDVQPSSAEAYTFYDFLTDYHERDHPYAPKAIVAAGSSITAILDGQQRLTALNIGVYGSHAEKKKYAWWNSPNAFPKKYLYLNLLADADPGELGLRYDLRFLTPEEATPEIDQPRPWYRVGDVLSLADSGPAMMDELLARGAGGDGDAFKRLYALHNALRVFKPINYYLEESQEADKVLDIFVRVNSGGTTLSYSDLLLSMATNQWSTLDAREEVRSLVQQMNAGGARDFAFSKDFVLKTALMVAGVDLRFKVSNFTQSNMAKVEAEWDRTRQALLRAATLLDRAGFSSRSLTAHSVVIPIAYYLARRDLSDSYLESTNDAPDRARLIQWVVRSLVKRGIWGSGLDQLLVRLRNEIDWNGSTSFPRAEIEASMAASGKSLAFDETEIDELLQIKFGSQRSFPVLSLLYPGLDFSKDFHEDHIYPRAYFSKSKLTREGIPVDLWEAYTDRVNLLPNLQLLPGTPNIEKQSTLPAIWLERAFSDEKRKTYIDDNDLQDITAFDGFIDFFDARRDRMKARLTKVLGADRQHDS